MTPIRDAATVLVLRDGERGVEVLLLRRTTKAVFSPGAHVFPGGAVDPDDAAPEVAALVEGLDDERASSVLGLPSGGLAYAVAALRELFEEAGLLLAYDRTGSLLRLDDPDEAARFERHRRALHASEVGFAAICHAEGLRLAGDRLHPFGHWITPPGGTRRFDTRFFVTRAPEGQVATHDRHETTEHGWHRPADVLAAHGRGEVDLVLPTQRSLERIAEAPDVDAVLRDADPAVA